MQRPSCRQAGSAPRAALRGGRIAVLAAGYINARTPHQARLQSYKRCLVLSLCLSASLSLPLSASASASAHARLIHCRAQAQAQAQAQTQGTAQTRLPLLSTTRQRLLHTAPVSPVSPTATLAGAVLTPRRHDRGPTTAPGTTRLARCVCPCAVPLLRLPLSRCICRHRRRRRRSRSSCCPRLPRSAKRSQRSLRFAPKPLIRPPAGGRLATAPSDSILASTLTAFRPWALSPPVSCSLQLLQLLQLLSSCS
jgi:hypothetical protein